MKLEYLSVAGAGKEFPGYTEEHPSRSEVLRGFNLRQLNKPIRLLLVDDHPVVRKGLRYCLAPQAHFEIAGEAGDGLEALRKARELLPDIMLMDIEMPRMSGLAVTKLLRGELPQIKVLILSMYRSGERVLRIVRSGARGFVFKDMSSQEMVKAIEKVAAGETYFGAEMARATPNQFALRTRKASKWGRRSNRKRKVGVRVAVGVRKRRAAHAAASPRAQRNRSAKVSVPAADSQTARHRLP